MYCSLTGMSYMDPILMCQKTNFAVHLFVIMREYRLQKRGSITNHFIFRMDSILTVEESESTPCGNEFDDVAMGGIENTKVNV